MAFDESGKVYVAEMLDYPDDPPPGSRPARASGCSKIPMATARRWRSTVFADHVLAVSGFMPWKGGLIVTSAPDILFIKTPMATARRTSAKCSYTGFAKSNQEARITNPRLGIDNWIYCSNKGNDGRITFA